MIKAITFDLDGVYFVNGKSNFISNLVKLGVPESEAKRVFLQSDEMNVLYKTGKMTDDEFWTWANNEWGLNKTPRELMDLLISGYEVDQNVVKTVKKVRVNGYKTLICTNNFPARINGLQERFKFLDDFDGKSISYEVGSSKPDSKIYQKLIEVSGVNTNEIVYADDNNDNISEAQKLGINAFFYEGFGKFLEKLKQLGVDVE
jgi:putative hydrolase of the HAD superfamily